MLNINENDFKNNIARKIKLYRKETQEKVAEQASISVDTLSSIERGLNVPSSLNLVNLSNALGVTPNDILEDFIFDKTRLLTTKLNIELNDFSSKELELFLAIIDLIKSYRK